MSGARKYITELMVSIGSSGWLMTTAEQIMSGRKWYPDELEVSRKCHIYFICKRPALYFDPNIVYRNGILSGYLCYKKLGEEKRVKFEMPFPLLDGSNSVRVSEYPHREIQTLDEFGNIKRFLPAYYIFLGLLKHRGNPDFEEILILYIGKAFGDGSRNTYDRLKSHDTLQNILARNSYENPDDEVVVFSFHFFPAEIYTYMDGKCTEENIISDERDTERVKMAIKKGISKEHQISLVEAAAIRYFKPKYNKVYKDSFPGENLKVLEQCYQLDFSGLSVSVGTENDDFPIDFKLYTDAAPAKQRHSIYFDLFDPDVRKGFFHMSDGEGGYFIFPDETISPVS